MDVKVFLILFLYILFVIFMIILSSSLIKNKNKSFKKIRGIFYYRDKLKDISPYALSYINNFTFEPQKDITALILSLYQKKLIDIQNNDIVIDTKNMTNLNKIESTLVNMIKENNFSQSKLDELEKLGIEELLNKGYIASGGNLFYTKLLSIPSLLYLCVLIISLIVISLGAFIPNSKIIINFLKVFPFIIPLIVIFIFVYFFITMSVETEKEKNNTLYHRTYKGQLLAENVNALKNFINDFSNLEKSKKDEIILWEDFLIYAVILSVNKEILNEICKIKNIDLDIIPKVNSIFK